MRRLIALLVLLVSAGVLKAQTLYGTLVGNVTDPSGASIAGAKVNAANTATGFSREATTDDRGSYLFSDLQPGAYRIAVTASGFAAFTQTDAQVSANAVLRADIRMQLSTSSESVTVA